GSGRTVLLHRVGASLAHGGILIASAAAAADCTNQLAALDQRKSAGTRDQGGIERADIGMASFECVVERTRFAAEAGRGAGLAHRNRAGGDLRAFHPLEL